MFKFSNANRSIVATLLLLAAASGARGQSAVSEWPERLEGPSGLITVFQPQPEKFDGNMLTARAAVSLTPPGQTDPQFGALWFTARVYTDRDAREVKIQDITVKQVKLPNASADQDKQFGDAVQQGVPRMNIVLSLDQLEATLSVAQKAKEESQQLQTTPPTIIFTQVPTTLVVLDGPPKLQQSEAAGVMTVVNTPFIMLFDLNSKTYYLRAGMIWLATQDIAGSWGQTNVLPPGVKQVGDKLSTQAAAQAAAQPVAQAAPGQPPAGAEPMPNAPTNIFVSQVPAELISSSGPPTYVPLPPGDLLYMSNTQSDVFMEVSTQHLFILLSGRWFTAPALGGPWAYVASDKLPAAFAKIPTDSPKANVLVSVAGTQAAKDARYDAYIPQTAVIQRNAGTGLNVVYDGQPQFVPIEGTSLTYAKNCADPVVFADNQYYCCQQGVWYQSPAATGPWSVSTVIPPAIYTIPPSCPIYNCRFCYVYDSTPDSVYCGYLPGYTGSYVYGGTIVYGTGYSYPSWYGNQYYAYPNTWGFNAQYDYFGGSWGFGVGYYYGRDWFANRPYEHRWWGPGGYIGYRDLRAIHQHDLADAHTRNVIDRINIYSRTNNARRNYVHVEANRVAAIDAAHEHAPGLRPEPIHPAYAHVDNNVYVGHDGAVYRRTDAGWEMHDTKGWNRMTNVPEARVEAERETQIHENTGRENVGRENEVQARENQGERNQVRENTQRGGGGLEEEHAARQRSSTPAPAQHAPANTGGGEHGGGGGGGHAGGGGGGHK